MTDKEALDAIARLMSGNEWNPDTTTTIADIVKATGRTILETP